MSNLDHIILFLFLFSLFSVWGYYAAKIRNKVDYWLSALIPISLYSLILGLRYGWGPDYLFYKYRLQHSFTYIEEQVGFRWLNQGINLAGFGFAGGFVIYSLIFILCAFILIRSYKKESVYMYAFVVPATLIFVNNAIRQGVALSFVLLGIYFLNEKKWLALLLTILIGSSIHTSILITVATIAVVFVLFKNALNWKITIPIYIFVTFFLDSKSIGIIAAYIQKYVSLDNKFQSYIDNADIWFGKEAVNDIYQQSQLTLIISSLFYVSIIYLGYVALKYRPNPRVVYIYNVLALGIIFYRIVFLFEILRRIAEPLVMLYFIVLGYSIFVFSDMKKNDINYLKSAGFRNMSIPLSFKYKLCMTCILSYLIMFWGRFIFLNPDALFFWNN